VVNTTIYYLLFVTIKENNFFQPPHVTLETLPKENVSQILSNLGRKDRKRVRRCSKSLREAVQQSDLSVELITIGFDEGHSIFVGVKGYYTHFGRTQLKRNDAQSFQNWLNAMKMRYFFRRLKCDGLCIQTEGMTTLVVDEPLFKLMTEQFDFKELHLVFDSRLQPSVISFAQRLKKPIQSITTYECAPDPLEIFELPWASSLIINHFEMWEAYTDQQVLELAKQGRRDLQLPADLSHTATLQSLIEIVHSCRMRCVSITVEPDYYHRFLSSIDLKEQGNQFWTYQTQVLPKSGST
ncbi:hypothetical protein PFISCL1PPCAC_3423, partial [Pristionchus fissidentatus]